MPQLLPHFSSPPPNQQQTKSTGLIVILQVQPRFGNRNSNSNSNSKVMLVLS